MRNLGICRKEKRPPEIRKSMITSKIFYELNRILPVVTLSFLQNYDWSSYLCHVIWPICHMTNLIGCNMTLILLHVEQKNRW